MSSDYKYQPIQSSTEMTMAIKQPFRKREIYSKEILPNTNTKAREHDIFFSQISKLFKRIEELSKQGKLIQNEDLKDYIPKSTQVKFTIEQLEDYHKHNPQNFSDPRNFNLSSVYLHMVGKDFITGLFYGILQSSLSCGCIFFMDMMTDLLKDFNGTSSQKLQFFLLLLTISISYLINNIITTRGSWCEAKWKVKTYTILQYLTFTKSLRSQIISDTSSMEQQSSSQSEDNEQEEERKNKKEEEEEQSIGDANNIMTVDIDAQLNTFWAIKESFISISTIALALLLIYYKIGRSIYNGLYVLLAALLFNVFLTYIMETFFKKLNYRRDQRVSLSRNVIEGMKNIKYLGWEHIFKKKIENVREKEFKHRIVTTLCEAGINIFWNSISYFLLYFFLMNFVNDGHSLAESNVFTIIALFGLITDPIGILPWSIAEMVKCQVSYKRIQHFLNQKEVSFNQDDSLCKIKQKSLEDQNYKIAIDIKQMNFKWSSKKQDIQEENQIQTKINELNDNTKEEQSAIDENRAHSNSNENLSSESGQNQGTNRKATFELRIKELTIQQGELAVIIGQIGSGKSALLQALLHELETSSIEGSTEDILLKQNIEDKCVGISGDNYVEKKNMMIINGRTCYVSQNHWLQNKTIKENILFGKEFDPVWYNECVEACDLIEDFNAFQKKDEKLVGPGGANLSGGQKQRIAICRALYQNGDIYLLDDIFSSLDAHVAKKVYQQVVLENLIKKHKKTVLLVTSHFGILSRKEDNQKIFLLKNGHLDSDQSQVQEFIQHGITQEQSQQDSQKNHTSSHTQSNNNQEIAFSSNKINANPNDLEEGQQIQDHSSKEKEEYKNSNEDTEEQEEGQEDEDEDDEEREKGNIKIQTYMIYFRQLGYFLLIVWFVANFFMEGSQMILDFWLRDYVQPSSAFFSEMNKILCTFNSAFTFFVVVNLSITSLRGVCFCICALRSGKNIFNRLNKSILFSNMAFFDKNPIGRIMNRLSEDVHNIDGELPCSYLVFLENVSYTFWYPIGIIVQFPYLIFIVAIAMGLIYQIQKTFRFSNREVKRLGSVNSGKLLTTLGETCKGIVLIRSFEKENYALKLYLENLNDIVNTNMISSSIQIWKQIRLLFVSNFLFICVAAASMILTLIDVNFNYNTVSMCLTYSMLLSQRFADFIHHFCRVEQNMISIERVSQYFQNEQEELDKVNQSPTKNNIQDNNNSITTDNDETLIELKNVSLSYDYDEIEQTTVQKQQDTDKIQYALKDICLKIKKGEKIAFCGRTGSGKTSILNALFNMYPICSGTISVEGKNINNYSLRELRSKMSIIPQFGFLYNASLKDNLDPEDRIHRDDIQRKIEETNLKIRNHSKDIHKNNNNNKQSGKHHKGDLDLQINESGQNLSNGEKQIVNFLRVILRDTEIVCLDEATSNMDPKTDKELHEQIFNYTQNRTLLVITHRLENIEQFDRVVVLDNGQIVENGSVDELKKNKDGFFSKLLLNNQI